MNVWTAKLFLEVKNVSFFKLTLTAKNVDQNIIITIKWSKY